MRRTQSGPPVAWIWAGVAVLAALLVSMTFWVVSLRGATEIPPSTRLVPDVTQMTYARASTQLAAQDLASERHDETNDSVAPGLVLRTDPEAGTPAVPGQTIKVYVSIGQKVSTVPTLTGLDEGAARSALQAAGLAVGAVSPKNDPALAKGTVISSDPVSGTVIATGSTVNMVVATGLVVLVNVTGYTVDAASRNIQSLQLTVQTADDPACKATNPRTVRAQSLSPGDVPIHSTVTLTSCSG